MSSQETALFVDIAVIFVVVIVVVVGGGSSSSSSNGSNSINIHKYNFVCFYMGMKLGVSYWGEI
jgi:hypothetical protein